MILPIIMKVNEDGNAPQPTSNSAKRSKSNRSLKTKYKGKSNHKKNDQRNYKSNHNDKAKQQTTSEK